MKLTLFTSAYNFYLIFLFTLIIIDIKCIFYRSNIVIPLTTLLCCLSSSLSINQAKNVYESLYYLQFYYINCIFCGVTLTNIIWDISAWSNIVWDISALVTFSHITFRVTIGLYIMIDVSSPCFHSSIYLYIHFSYKRF